MLKALLLASLATLASVTAASAQVAVDDIRIQLFREPSGTWSDNIVGLRKSFVNTVTGGGDAGEPAEAVLVTFVVTGPKSTRSSDKIARDLVSVTVTQSAKTGTRVLLKRAYGGFFFGEDGRSHKAFLLENATCAPLEVDIRLGRSRKTVKIDFQCDG